MKTSFTKWNPDPDGAASEYIKAGNKIILFYMLKKYYRMKIIIFSVS